MEAYVCPKPRRVEGKYAFYCSFVLVLVSVLDQADRWALPTLQGAGLQCSSCINDSFVTECHNMCLNLSDVGMGILTGPALSFSSLFLMLPLGWIADHYSRTRLLSLGLFVWTFATCACALITEFWQLILARIALGIGQATVTPTAYSLLADYFGARNRALALSVFTSMVFLGVDFGLLMGIVSQKNSWRTAFLVLGIPGFIVFGLLLFTVKDPIRGQKETSSGVHQEYAIIGKEENESKPKAPEVTERPYPETFVGQMKEILSVPFMSLWVTCALRSLATFGLSSWMQVFYRRNHGLEPTRISLILAVVIPLGGLTSSYIGGWAADYYGRANPATKSWICAISSLGGAIFMIPMLVVQMYWLSFTMLFFAFLFAEAWNGPALAIVQDLVNPKLRSLATTIFCMTTAIGSLAPLIIGELNETFNIPSKFSTEPGSFDPSLSLLIMVPGMYALCVIGFSITAVLLAKHQQDDEANTLTVARH